MVKKTTDGNQNSYKQAIAWLDNPRENTEPDAQIDSLVLKIIEEDMPEFEGYDKEYNDAFPSYFK